ncbi:NAD(P)/FAD-dependent oxidoreductase [Candidatus Saccharibacteria bacterium]|nr:NAD(P)/FAD-dependent oxidoreductase [Candidatus Saccharibacteria bacterium]
MGKNFDFDYIVIGSGTAGSAAALMAAGAGLSVALIEANQWGGSELCSRNIPYKAALHFSHEYAQALKDVKMGLSSANLRYNYPTYLGWRFSVTKKCGAGNKKRFEDAGITCIKGFAHFVGPNTVAVDNKQFTGRKFLIATGSILAKTNIAGAGTETCLTPSNILNLKRLPKVAMVVGAGATGCEIANYLAELGVKVLLAESKKRVLPKEDTEVGQLMGEYFEKKVGIKVLTGAKVIAIEQEKTAKKVIFAHEQQEKAVRVEAVVLATGAAPATDLGLENADVKYDKDGILVDRTLVTTNKSVLAAGDVLGGESSAEKASYQAAIATSNIINRNKGAAEKRHYVRVVDTLPQVACIGMTEEDCKKKKIKYLSAITPISQLATANITGLPVGFVKMLADRDGKILGAAIVSPQADIVIQEIVLAMKAGLKPLDIASTPHAAGTWAEAVRLTARKIAR